MKTLEQKIAELDAKFEGFGELIEKVKPIGGLPFANYEIGSEIFFMFCNLRRKSCEIGFSRRMREKAVFGKETLEEAISKAHEVFCEKGVEL